MKSYNIYLYKKASQYPNLNHSCNHAEKDLFSSELNLDISEGTVILCNKKKSAVFLDGRYQLEAKNKLDFSKFDLLDLAQTTIVNWIKHNISENENIYFPSELYKISEIQSLQKQLQNYKFQPIPNENNIKLTETKPLIIYSQNKINNYWEPVSLVEFTANINNYKQKKEILEIMKINNLDAYLLCDTSTICWALNIRDLDNQYSLDVLCFAIIEKNGIIKLYIDRHYHFETNNIVKSQNSLLSDLLLYKRIGLDETQTPVYLSSINYIHIKNPFLLEKSIKSEYEISNIKQAAIFDSVIFIKLMYWLYNNKTSVSELDIVTKISELRKMNNYFISESFPTIAAADQNAAFVHYHPSSKNNKSIEKLLLIDAGAQYHCGTTDITRTFFISKKKPSKSMKLSYTLVLKGHIALMKQIFPHNTSGAYLDVLARSALFNKGKNYPHSTGHGIGYVGNVHEGPCAISVNNNISLKEGMVLSNEPGIYIENAFGIRLENMIVVTKTENNHFLKFETISLIPFEGKLIHLQLLTKEEKNTLHQYYNAIKKIIFPYLSYKEKIWTRMYMKL